MEAYFAFTDECGDYQRIRSAKFNRAHPFYVRSTVIISLTDYLLLQRRMDQIKESFGLSPNIEVKWAHYGSALKNNYSRIPHHMSHCELKEYYKQTLLLLCDLKSAAVYYTLTDNNSIGKVNEIALLKMHLQNAYQRVQATVSEKNGFAIVVADDLNEKTKALKRAIFELTLEGDYVQYTNIKKGMYIDCSDQCHGLQIADICAGTFTASLKQESAPQAEKHKYECGHNLFFCYTYKKTRNSFSNPPHYDIYKSGVKEVPNGAGDVLARTLSRQIEALLERDLMQELYEIQED